MSESVLHISFFKQDCYMVNIILFLQLSMDSLEKFLVHPEIINQQMIIQGTLMFSVNPFVMIHAQADLYPGRLEDCGICISCMIFRDARQLLDPDLCRSYGAS